MWPILGENLVLLWAFEQFSVNDALLHDVTGYGLSMYILAIIAYVPIKSNIVQTPSSVTVTPILVLFTGPIALKICI